MTERAGVGIVQLTVFRLRGAAAAGPGHRQDRRGGEVQVRGLAVAGGHTELCLVDSSNTEL